MLPSQVILSAIIILIISRTLATRRKKNLSKNFLFLWLCFWIGSLFLILQTKVISKFAEILKIGRGVDLAIYLSIILMFYLIFKLFIRINEAEEKITKLVRKQTIEETKSKRV